MIAEDVIGAVCQHFCTTTAALEGPSRAAVLTRPRMLAMALLRSECMHSYPMAAEWLGRRDHGSAMRATRMVAAGLAAEGPAGEQWRSDRAEVLRRAAEIALEREEGPRRGRGRRVQFCCSLDVEQVDALRAWSAATHVPAAELVRQGVDMVVAKLSAEATAAGARKVG